jgi:hypothetical protein
MDHKFDIKSMDNKIQLLKKISEDILEEADGFPSLSRNCCRILASIKMIELNVSDIQGHD